MSNVKVIKHELSEIQYQLTQWERDSFIQTQLGWVGLGWAG